MNALSHPTKLISKFIADFLTTLRFMVGNPFRILMLVLWILSLSLLLVVGDDIDRNDESVENEPKNSLAVALAVLLPMSLTSITLVYTFQEVPLLDKKSKQEGLIFRICLFSAGFGLFWLLGVFWFMFETVILALTAAPIVKWINGKFSHPLSNTRATRATTLSLLSVIFLVPAFSLSKIGEQIYELLEVQNLEETPYFFGPLLGGTIILTITTWALFIYWERNQTPYSVKLLENLPWMYCVAMVICYFETLKGIFVVSELKWMQFWAPPIEIGSALFVLIVALFSATSEIRETMDMDIPLEVPSDITRDLKKIGGQLTIGQRNIIPSPIRKLIPSKIHPYALALWVLILYLSKHFYESILGVHEDLMQAAIVFTFISLFVLSFQIKNMMSVIDAQTQI